MAEIVRMNFTDMRFINGKNGHSPYIGSDGFWYVYNDETSEYEKTSFKAQGEGGSGSCSCSFQEVFFNYSSSDEGLIITKGESEEP